VPGICTASSRAAGVAHCGHIRQTIDLDGESIELRTGLYDGRWNDPLDAGEKLQMLQLAARWWKGKGETIDTFAAWVGRVLVGVEGTNVRSYDLMGPGSAVTRTNIGTAYVNVMPGANGERVLVDFTGATQFRIILTANLVAVGPFQARVVRDSDSAVLYESPSLTQTGERELDTDWQTLPAAASGLQLVRLQAKSTTATDDPVFRRCVLLIR
jgi:hypothetical protein